METYSRPNELCHYGVLGMKWGRHRFNVNYKRANKFYDTANRVGRNAKKKKPNYYTSSKGSMYYQNARTFERRANRYKAKLARDGIHTKSMKQISAKSKEAGRYYIKKKAGERVRDYALRAVVPPIPSVLLTPSIRNKYKMNKDIYPKK